MTFPQPEEMSQTPVEELSYEQAFTELEAIVGSMEANQFALEQALSLFERGQALARRCSSLLEGAELKVQQLSGGELVDFPPSQDQI
jgi:exodeoxyribonuclease VII small subunit